MDPASMSHAVVQFKPIHLAMTVVRNEERIRRPRCGIREVNTNERYSYWSMAFRPVFLRDLFLDRLTILVDGRDGLFEMGSKNVRTQVRFGSRKLLGLLNP
jgi:hypothetical protein